MEENKKLERIIEIIPGLAAWFTLLLPFILAPFAPLLVAYFIILFSLYWFFKGLNFARHLVFGYKKMTRYMKTDWYKRCQHLSSLDKCILHLEGHKNHDQECLADLKQLYKVNGQKDAIKKLDDIYHVVLIAIYQEEYHIVEPSLKAVLDSNFPNEKIFIVLACEGRESNSVKIAETLKKKYAKDFYYFDYFVHPDNLPDEVKGKGPNIAYAGEHFKKYFDKEERIEYEDVLVTNIDADHIIHREYLGRLTYKYIIDPNRERKTYQPVALLFNNIWDAPVINRILAVSSSFWQMIESMRPFRQRTFAAHTQSLKTLVKTNFWAKHTIVEDGHQYWRTYFAYGGHIDMVPLMVPIYQDAVLLDNYWDTFKAQYKQMRRWAWGVSDLPFIILNYRKHKEIPFFEKFTQTGRHFVGSYSWSTASFLIAGAWVPLFLNKDFQETVLAHNVTKYSSFVMELSWFAVFFSIWIYFSLLPKRPQKYGPLKNLGMVFQWLIAPITAIFASSLPALEAQTRLMLGKRLEFWSTPKVRKSSPILHEEEEKIVK